MKKKTITPDETITLEAGRAEGLSEALAHALIGVKKGANVLVVDPDAWCQEVELSVKRVQGVTGDTLSQLVAYEAESFTGLPSKDSAVCYRRESTRGDIAIYRVLEIARADLLAAQRAAKQVGVRLVGVTHPDFVEARLFIAPPPEPLSIAYYLKRSALLAGVVALVAVLVNLYFSTERNSLGQRLAALEALQNQCRAIESQARNEQSAANQFLKRIDDEIKPELRRIRARRSYTRILDALASTCPEGGLVNSIRSNGDYTLLIEGVTISSADAELFLKKLGTSLKPGGFALATLSLDSKNQLPGGGPWAFKCRIQPVPGEVEK